MNPPRFRLPVVLLAALLAASARADIDALQDVARRAQFPRSVNSSGDFAAFVSANYTGGRIDTVRPGGVWHKVVFLHGSGRAVIAIGVYRRMLTHWKLVAAPAVPSPANEFLRAETVDGKIAVRGDHSSRRWLIHEPAKIPGEPERWPLPDNPWPEGARAIR